MRRQNVEAKRLVRNQPTFCRELATWIQQKTVTRGRKIEAILHFVRVFLGLQYPWLFLPHVCF